MAWRARYAARMIRHRSIQPAGRTGPGSVAMWANAVALLCDRIDARYRTGRLTKCLSATRDDCVNWSTNGPFDAYLISFLLALPLRTFGIKHRAPYLCVLSTSIAPACGHLHSNQRVLIAKNGGLLAATSPPRICYVLSGSYRRAG